MVGVNKLYVVGVNKMFVVGVTFFVVVGVTNSHFKIFDEWISDLGQTPLDVCLKFINSYEHINKVIVGVQSTDQLFEMINAVASNDSFQAPEHLEMYDEMLINPSNWNIGGDDGH